MRFILLGTLFANTASDSLSEAFTNIQYNVAKATTFRSSMPTRLAFHQHRLEEFDYRMPAESFTFTRYAKTAVTSEYVQSKWKDLPSPERLSYLDVISSTASGSKGFDQKQEEADSETQEEPLAQAHRIQQAYREWCEFYGKVPNKERLGVFATNFLAVQEFHERTRRPLVLNEFADLTEEEYRQGHESSKTSEEYAPTEERIREAYIQWCDYYDRPYDEKRLRTFAANFIVVEKYHMQTKESLVLNEYADMTEKEYRKHLETAAHFTTPENIGPRANEVTTSYLPEPKEASKPIDDPITSYLDPEPSPVKYTQVEELKPPIPKAKVEIVQSSNDSNIPPVPPLETMQESTVSNEVLATLQNTVNSLTKMVQSLAARPTVAPEPKAEPLDSLVIDVLQQQDGSISQLEESVEGLHDIQKQSSDLIELVSNNQRQMTEMMESVQTEVSLMQQEQQYAEDNYALLLKRIEDLEEAVAKYDSGDPVLNQSLVFSSGRGPSRIELKPNLPPIGYEQPQIQP